MADLDALFRQILANRRDDAPRVAYADALGDVPRAEFIKVQIALAGGRALVGREYYDSRRERALLQGHGREWAADVAPLLESYVFRRGFIEYIVASGAAFLRHAETLFSKAPILDVGLRDVPAGLFNCRRLDGLRSLNLGNAGVTDADVDRLVASPYLRDLRWLELSANRITDKGMEALVASDNLPALQWVGLAYNPGDDPTPQPITEGSRVHGSERSSLTDALIAKYGERTWLRGPGMHTPRPWEF